MTRSPILLAVLLSSLSAQPGEVETVTRAAQRALKEVDIAPPAQRLAVANRGAQRLLALSPRSQEARAIIQAEALHLLVHAGQMEEVFSRASRLSPSDPVWKRVLPVLLEASDRQQDYSRLARIASLLQGQAPEASTRQLAAMAAGESLWRTGNLEQARSAFQAAAGAAPGSAAAGEALRRWKDLTELAPGNPAPKFRLAARDGAVLSNDSAKGRVVLLHFWASWCAACKAHIPVLAGLKNLHQDRLLLVSISLDADCEAAGRWTNSTAMTWPSVCDGAGEAGAAAKAFAVGGVPELVLIDRRGLLAGKNPPHDRLPAIVGELVEESRAGRYSQELLRESRTNLPEIFSALGVKPGSHVADIGAGEGFLALRLARAVGPQGKVYAVDIDQTAIGEIGRRASRAGFPNIVPIRSTQPDPMLPSGQLDAVVLLRTYHDILPCREMLARIRSALRPGGRLVIVDAGPAPARRHLSRNEQTSNHELDLGIAEGELVQADFRVIRSMDPFIPSISQEQGAMWLLAAERPSTGP